MKANTVAMNKLFVNSDMTKKKNEQAKPVTIKATNIYFIIFSIVNNTYTT